MTNMQIQSTTKAKLILGLLLVSFGLSGCDWFLPECERKNQAKVTFHNNGPNNSQIWNWDGTARVTLNAGQMSEEYNESEGTHTLSVTGGGGGCSAQSVTLSSCDSYTYTCSN